MKAKLFVLVLFMALGFTANAQVAAKKEAVKAAVKEAGAKAAVKEAGVKAAIKEAVK